MPIEKTPFARKIEELTSEKRISFRELARSSGVSPAAITRVLKGDLPPSKEFVEKLTSGLQSSTRQKDHLIFLAEISQPKIVIVPKTEEQARKAVAFKRELEEEERG